MPELPEVETARRSLAPVLESARVVSVVVNLPRMLRRQPHPADFSGRLLGRQIATVGRHGKYLISEMDGDISWVVHLGMSGRIAVVAVGSEVMSYTQVQVGLDSGREFRLIDPRTFGFVVAYTPEELAASTLSKLGPDAHTGLPRSRELRRLLAGRTAPIKPLLLDQRIIAGIGNIYADESLHRAKLDPHRPGGSLSVKEVQELRRAIKATLESALRWGGTSLDDLAYLLPDGRAGEYLSRLRAYGREDEPCHRCGGRLRRDVLRGRSTFWCPHCQR